MGANASEATFNPRFLNGCCPETEVVLGKLCRRLGTTDFPTGAHNQDHVGGQPDLLISSVWVGDYVRLLQAGACRSLRPVRQDEGSRSATIAFWAFAPPCRSARTTRRAVLGPGVHSNYHFTYPWGGRPLAAEQELRAALIFERWKEYPNFQFGKGAYVALSTSSNPPIDRATSWTGGWGPGGTRRS